MLNLGAIMIGSENPKALVEFYGKVFQSKPMWEEGEFNGYQAGNAGLMIGPHDKVHGKAQNPERIIFFLETNDVKGEFDRIKGLGAEVIAEPYQPGEEAGDMWLATLADPDGNYFQLATPYKPE
jgi:predicted enzyme related to lactoylglutathione lyase